jgi:hypothetical protein
LIHTDTSSTIGTLNKNPEIRMKQRWILSLLVLCAMVCAGSGVRAQSFFAGFGIGLPTLAEARLGYVEQNFGVRLYAGYFIISELGVDGYARTQTDWGAWRIGGGLAYLTEGFLDTRWLAVRALLGAELRLSDSVLLTLEWRPGFPVLLSPGYGPGSAFDNLLQYLFLALNLGLEFLG